MQLHSVCQLQIRKLRYITLLYILRVKLNCLFKKISVIREDAQGCLVHANLNFQQDRVKVLVIFLKGNSVIAHMFTVRN